MSEKHIGKVIQVIGPGLDIQFQDGNFLIAPPFRCLTDIKLCSFLRTI